MNSLGRRNSLPSSGGGGFGPDAAATAADSGEGLDPGRIREQDGLPDGVQDVDADAGPSGIKVTAHRLRMPEHGQALGVWLRGPVASNHVLALTVLPDARSADGTSPPASGLVPPAGLREVLSHPVPLGFFTTASTLLVVGLLGTDRDSELAIGASMMAISALLAGVMYCMT